jgi:hypothetical protein
VFPFASLHPNAGALLRREILLLPDSLQNYPVSSQGGEKHCIELTPNDSIISVSSNATQEQQHAGENSTQNGEEMRPNGPRMHHRMSSVRHEANQPRISAVPGSLGESASGSARASEEIVQASGDSSSCVSSQSPPGIASRAGPEETSRSVSRQSPIGAASNMGPGAGSAESSLDTRRDATRGAARATPSQPADAAWQDSVCGARSRAADSPTRSSARQDARQDAGLAPLQDLLRQIMLPS